MWGSSDGPYLETGTGAARHHLRGGFFGRRAHCGGVSIETNRHNVMEQENNKKGSADKNRRTWILLGVLIAVIVTAIVYGAVVIEQQNNTRLNAVEQQNSQLQANQNQLQQENSQLQTNQGQLQQENDQLQANQLQQECNASCVSHSSLFSTTTWEYCSNTLGCRTFPTQQACVNSCVTNP